MITGTTRLFAIFGDPLSKARTPEGMNALFAEHSIDAVMVPAEVDAAGFAQAVTGFKRLRNCDGLILTMPHKQAMCAHVDELRENGRRVGAINAARRLPDGRWIGDMFDGLGYVGALRRHGIDPAGKHVHMIGAGGVARAMAMALAQAGIAALTLRDLAADRAAGLAQAVSAAFPEVETRAGAPRDGATVQVLGDSTPTFTWSNVVDSSGVAYTLQVGSTPDFSKLVLEKTGIPVNQYNVTSAEALPPGRYYWRIKAVDGASNGSSWSPGRSLKSGIIPLWVWALPVILGAGVLGLGVWLTRRRPVATPRKAVSSSEIPVPRIIPGHWLVGQSEEVPADGTKIVRDFADALHQKDLEKALALYDDDADLEAPEGEYKGKAEIKGYWSRLFSTDSGLNFTDSGIGVMAQGNKAVYEYLLSGATKGKGWQRSALDVYEFKDGRVRRHRIVHGRLTPDNKKQ